MYIGILGLIRLQGGSGSRAYLKPGWSNTGRTPHPSVCCAPGCVIKYADDVTLSMHLQRFFQYIYAYTYMSTAHDQLTTRSTTVRLQLNMKKCKALIFPKSPTCSAVHLPDVEFVSKVTLLDVIFNSSCTWTYNVDKLVKTASRRLFPLRLLKPQLDPHELNHVYMYYGIMCSVMDYTATLFVGISKKDTNRIQWLQIRFHRLLISKGPGLQADVSSAHGKEKNKTGCEAVSICSDPRTCP